jgi:hypothetical protein
MLYRRWIARARFIDWMVPPSIFLCTAFTGRTLDSWKARPQQQILSGLMAAGADEQSAINLIAIASWFREHPKRQSTPEEIWDLVAEQKAHWLRVARSNGWPRRGETTVACPAVVGGMNRSGHPTQWSIYGDTSMRITRRDIPNSEDLLCTIQSDPGGNRAPWVSLEDGTEVGPLEYIVRNFDLVDMSENEARAIQRWHRMIDLGDHARYVEEQFSKAERAMFEFLSDCEQFFEHADELGFHVPPMPRIPGVPSIRSIKVEHWSAMDPARRPAILRALLIGVDWRRKMSEWNYERADIDVVSENGDVLTTVTLREGYQGPIA